jgi:putative nucleotidyltransferase with HDIG domain/PAS domain S-box-containing protein
MAVENYSSTTNLDPKMMRWRPKKPNEKKGKEAELLSPEEIAKLIDELTLNSIALATQKEELNKIQEGYRELQNQYNDLYENTPIGYATVDRSGLIFQINLAVSTMLKAEKPSLLGLNLIDYIIPESQDIFYSLIEKVFERKSPQSCEISLRKTDGSTLATRLEGSFINNSASSEPIPLCRIAIIINEQETKAEEQFNSDVYPPSDVKQQEGADRGAISTEEGIQSPPVVGVEPGLLPLNELKTELQDSLNTTAKMVEMRDSYSVGHQQKVSKLAIALARELGMSEEQVKYIGIAGLVHDIGKINVPSELLVRKNRLQDMELKQIQEHVTRGHDILTTMGFPAIIATIVLQHHERLDGSGYPLGLSGDAILPESRILAVADSYEAMCSQRAYRPARSSEEALEELFINKGILYDSDVVQACLKLFNTKGFKYD